MARSWSDVVHPTKKNFFQCKIIYVCPTLDLHYNGIAFKLSYSIC